MSDSGSLKLRLLSGLPSLGIFLLSGSPSISEACAKLGFDWLLLDMEASPTDRRDVLHFLQSVQGSTSTPLVRVPNSEHATIEQILDLGPQGIVVPKVHDGLSARRIVEACRFPPVGKRGLNPVRASGYFSDIAGYLREANDRTLCFAQVESAEALRNLEDIASTPGIDGLFVGCGDLALSLGCTGEMRSPPMVEAIDRVLVAASKHGKIPGIFAYDLALAAEYLQAGYLFVALGNEIKALRSALEAWLATARSIESGKIT